MIGHVFENRKDFYVFFSDGKSYHNIIPKELTHTWSHSKCLENYKNIEYANLYKNARSFKQACPNFIKNDWIKIQKRIKSFLISYKSVGIDLYQYHLHELLPIKLWSEYLQYRNNILHSIFWNLERLKNYELIKNNMIVFSSIEKQRLNLNYDNLKSIDDYGKIKIFNKNLCSYIKYNFLGTKIGGLSLKKNSFPILNLNKKFRKVIFPKNDFFVEIDYNAAHFRILLALSDIQQPKQDIHEWNKKYIFKNDIDRNTSKKLAFKWLYSNEKSNFDNVYKKEKIISKYYQNNMVKNIFDREIQSDKYHCLNYIISSTFNDMFSQQFYKIYELLKNKKTFITAMIHDSILLDFSKSELNLLKDIKKTFSNTLFGEFKVNLSIGKNFGEMKECIK